ncbi:MAG: ABC transporter permease [Salinigranum sp.]
MASDTLFGRLSGFVPAGHTVRARWRRWRAIFGKLLGNYLTLLGIVVIVAYILVAIFAPMIAPPAGGNPYEMPRDWGASRAPPLTPGHPLGTTNQGGDILYGIVWGSRLSIAIALSVVIASTVIGVVLGGVAGFVGGKVDELIMRTIDMLISIPALVWAIAVVTALGVSYMNIAIALTTMLWGSYGRIIRGEVIHVKNEDYVDAARVVGVSERSLFLREVLPNAVPPIFVQSTLYFGRVVLIAASVAFIGLAEPGLAEWGRLVALGQDGLMAGRWWASFFPGVAIFFWAFGWNMVGDGLRDIIDPRTDID